MFLFPSRMLETLSGYVLSSNKSCRPIHRTLSDSVAPLNGFEFGGFVIICNNEKSCYSLSLYFIGLYMLLIAVFLHGSDNHLQLDAQVSLQGKKKSSKRITGFQVTFCRSDSYMVDISYLYLPTSCMLFVYYHFYLLTTFGSISSFAQAILTN